KKAFAAVTPTSGRFKSFGWIAVCHTNRFNSRLELASRTSRSDRRGSAPCTMRFASSGPTHNPHVVFTSLRNFCLNKPSEPSTQKPRPGFVDLVKCAGDLVISTKRTSDGSTEIIDRGSVSRPENGMGRNSGDQAGNILRQQCAVANTHRQLT